MELDSPSYHCYGIRRLNPFLGVVQVMANSDSRAISLDGHNWELQVRAEVPADTWGSIASTTPILQFLRFGIWSVAGGLRKVPANPLLDLSRMIRITNSLVQALETRQQALPFPLADRFEFWLLDEIDHAPLALLASAPGPDQFREPDSPRWKCGDRRQQDFEAAETDRVRPPHPKDTDPHPHMSALERLVRIRSGRAGARWFERDDSGGGRVFPAEWPAQTDPPALPKETFPALLLQESWEDPCHRSLVRDYQTWLAPYLLTLQDISEEGRRRLEKAAGRRALLVDDVWRLYPRLISPGIIDSARVEARLRRNGGN